MNYINENDLNAAAWLRELRDAKLIPPCDIDTRSIEDVIPRDLDGYAQCHFFAGIAGWPLALQLAGWPADRPIWTGSCPCQPFSAAGKGAGFDDERHLWPAFHWLIEQCRPPVVVGEQVASAAAGSWLDLVLADLEALGYAGGAYAGPAAGVGAPHLRDRTYWVGYTGGARLQERERELSGRAADAGTRQAAERTGVHTVRLANADGANASAERQQSSRQQRQQPEDRRAVDLGNTNGQCKSALVVAQLGPHSGATRSGDWPGPTNGVWRAADWLGCRDGKWRPVEPGTFPLGHGLPARLGRLRGYGNAIVPQQAAEFVKALMAYQIEMP